MRPPAEVLGDAADGARAIAAILRAATTARWPMYLRNFKQLLRAASFDERSYGFMGLMDLLRACEREGLIRVERDRRRGLRLFQGSALGPVGIPRSAAAHGHTPHAAAIAQPTPEDLEAADNIGNTLDVSDIIDATELPEPPPTAVVDTPAELLGRAKPRRPRATRAAAAATAAPKRGARKAATSKRTSRSRKTDDGNS
jgi:hypothetical protein